MENFDGYSKFALGVLEAMYETIDYTLDERCQYTLREYTILREQGWMEKTQLEDKRLRKISRERYYKEYLSDKAWLEDWEEYASEEEKKVVDRALESGKYKSDWENWLS